MCRASGSGIDESDLVYGNLGLDGLAGVSKPKAHANEFTTVYAEWSPLLDYFGDHVLCAETHPNARSESRYTAPPRCPRSRHDSKSVSSRGRPDPSGNVLDHDAIEAQSEAVARAPKRLNVCEPQHPPVLYR